MTILSLDFELAGELNLTQVGSDVWTRHKNTVPILAGFAIDHDEPHAFLLDPYFGVSAKQALLLNAIDDGAEIHAWNAGFEFNVWNNICAPRFGWPALPIERFHCTMATAACAGLPMALDDAAAALNSSYRKDKIGHGLMKRMSRPRSDKGGKLRWWHRESALKLQQLTDYNLADVRAERDVHLRIPRMSKREREIWLVDQHMNMRGLPVDKDLLTALHAITLQELLRLNQDIDRLTNGVVSGATVNARLLTWAQIHGYPFDTLEKDTLAEFIQTDAFQLLNGAVRGVLAARAEAAKTSTAKLKSIASFSQLGGVARNLTQYGGAVRTLRWAGRGPQIQNFPRPVVKHIPEAITEILEGMDADGLRLLFGRPLDVVSSCLRSVFKAPEGKRLVVCDYHAIEAIVIAWLTDFEDMLDVFHRGEDIYVFTAQAVGSNDRKMGKPMRLGLNYGMGHVKFVDTAKGYGVRLTLAEARTAVDAFRRANAPIVSFWHACEASARSAILNPTRTFAYKKLQFRMALPDKRLAGALLMTLPSGRNLIYRNARIDSSGRIVFWGVNQYTRQWCELDTYGGKLVENATQAVARDLLAETMVLIERAFPGVLLTTVHDEIVAMTDTAKADELFANVKSIMRTTPAWGLGLPLSAAGAVVERYGKI